MLRSVDKIFNLNVFGASNAAGSVGVNSTGCMTAPKPESQYYKVCRSGIKDKINQVGRYRRDGMGAGRGSKSCTVHVVDHHHRVVVPRIIPALP